MLNDNLISSSKDALGYLVTLIKWIVFSCVIGSVCGLMGILFHYTVDIATHTREQYPAILYALPVAGIIIVFLYKICGMDRDMGTNGIIQSVRSSDKVSIIVAPLIIISTALTHLCGGSSGREGAALQIGGSIGSLFSRVFKLGEYNTSVALMCGMSALFSAVFGTPLTAAIFSLEVVSVGIMHYSALFPSVLSAIVAHYIASLFHVEATFFTIKLIPEFDILIFSKVIVLATIAALLSIVFIITMHSTRHLFEKWLGNKYIRIILGGGVVIALTLLVGNYDYNGAGMNIITKAIEEGAAAPGAFVLKLIFTAVTLSAGFKGGEIVPTFFIGSTFGVFVAPVIGLDPSFAAAIGLVSLFCGVVNCPVASIVLSIEIFGTDGLLYFAIASSVSYIISGYYSLYSSQKIMYSKLHSVFIDKDAK